MRVPVLLSQLPILDRVAFVGCGSGENAAYVSDIYCFTISDVPPFGQVKVATFYFC